VVPHSGSQDSKSLPATTWTPAAVFYGFSILTVLTSCLLFYRLCENIGPSSPELVSCTFSNLPTSVPLPIGRHLVSGGTPLNHGDPRFSSSLGNMDYLPHVGFQYFRGERTGISTFQYTPSLTSQGYGFRCRAVPFVVRKLRSTGTGSLLHRSSSSPDPLSRLSL
jgi:hypothetical protein